MAKYVIGLDVGQARDYTALVVAARWTERRKEGPPLRERTVAFERYDLVHVERWREIPYPVQVARVAERVKELQGKVYYPPGHYKPAYDNEVTLIVDATGVGKPILDALKQAGLRPHGVMITAGDTETRTPGITRVPKRILVSRLQIVLEGGRLKIARELPLASTLLEEFKGFKAKITLSGHDTYGNDVGQWREAEHDDMVLATSLITWEGEKRAGVVPVEALYRASGRTPHFHD